MITNEEKKSFGITTSIFAIMLLFLVVSKCSPNKDLVDLEGGGGGGGVTVNFGDSDVGSGPDYHSEVLKVTEAAKQTPAAAAPEDEVLASEDDEAPAVINTPKEPVKKEPKKEEAKQAEVKKQQPSKTVSNALDNMLSGNNKGGDGDDGVAGNKGKPGGDKNSSSYYGDGGSGGGRGGGDGSGDGTGTGPGSGSGSGGGSGAGVGTGVGNWKLAGRKPLAMPKPKGCNEEGKVVIEITVDNTGKVIKAEKTRGTLTSSQCLINQAKQAAMTTKWDSGDSASGIQVGTITYNFSFN